MSQENGPWEFSRERAHPVARDLLKDNFFWAIADDGAPLGSDTGSDTLAMYRKWRESNPGKTLELPLLDILKKWDERTSGGGPWDEAALRETLAEDGLEIVDNNDYVIALAFAQLVVEGAIDSGIRELAVKAIRREAMDVIISYRGWSSVKERRSRLEKMRQVLEAVGQS